MTNENEDYLPESDVSITDADIAEIIEHDIDALVAERDSFKDIALRLQADFENFKKRSLSQQADEVDRAGAGAGHTADGRLHQRLRISADEDAARRKDGGGGESRGGRAAGR